MKKPKLGSGERFRLLSQSIQRKQGISKERADAIAAAIGRQKYGAEKMAKMAAEGRRRVKK